MKKYKIGIFGSKTDQGETIEEKAKELGRLLANEEYIIITGAGSGVPYQVAHEAAKNSAQIWGYSIATDIQSHKKWLPHYDESIYNKLIFVPKEFELVNDFISRAKYRNIISTYNCDAAIIISGDWGALDELTHLMAYNKLVGVLTGTGGITQFIPELVNSLKKIGDGNTVIMKSSVKELVDEIKKSLSK